MILDYAMRGIIQSKVCVHEECRQPALSFQLKSLRLTGQQLSDLLVLRLSSDCKRVGSERCLHLRIVEVDDGAVILDHVDLLDAGNRVHLKF